ncbi:MAG: 5-oxoprolinase subunit PxpB [Thiothrix sp.]|nr:5-oxoprolinase subunit PxpB [Thiothrix sp.]HPQ96625.1 5-oxoprolinase subunit PxpB [Thiolinea sp.]
MMLRIEGAGENALMVYFGAETSPALSAQVQQAARLMEALLGPHLVDMVPSYASLLVIFDGFSCDHLQVRRLIRTTLEPALTQPETQAHACSRVVELPVWYGTEAGPDLEALSVRAGLTPEAVIDIHQSGEYRVYAIGFAPGFAYLGQVDERIAAPRLATPRLKVPRGAVAIADRQTAVYPAVSPGGWNLIGLCPTRMFNPDQEPVMPVSVGDVVRFHAISRDEFLARGGELP